MTGVQTCALPIYCVRAEDLAVRAAPGEFYLALPNTPADEARMVADRICAIAECTAYEGADPTRPFRLTLSSNVVEPDSAASAPQAIEAALNPTRQPGRFAAYA